MNSDDETTPPTNDGPFMRATAALADLDSPFYAEERERDVWNEASAVGFQFFLWTIPGLASVALWLVGRAALPYVTGALALWFAGAILTLGYAARLGVDPTRRGPLRGRRAVIFGMLMVVLSGGLYRALLPVVGDETIPSLLRGGAQGAMYGLPLGLIGAALGLWLDSRKRRTGQPGSQTTP